MKKIFVILLTICLIACVLSITAFAEDEPAGDTVLRIRAMERDGTIVDLEGGDYDNFEDGWNAAMEFALSKEMKKYDRVVVDFYADWNADAGNFTDDWWNNGVGFDWDTIYIKDDIRVTINLNGHKIDRGLEAYEYDGEVIYIDEDADVIINDGTITGGWSCNGAGGIHIHDADVVLNNVNIIGNNVEDDDGAGIALYDGANLTMNGGSIADNTIISANVSWVYGAGIYMDDSAASFNNVTFKNNHSGGRYAYTQDQTETYSTYGAAIYANDSNVTIDSCYFYDNGYKHGNFYDVKSVICVRDVSDMTIKNTIFRSNADFQHFTNGHSDVNLGAMLFDLGYSNVTIEKCQFTDNRTTVLFDVDSDSTLCVSDTRFTDNVSAIYYGSIESSSSSYFVNCIFDRNSTPGKYPYSFEFVKGGEQPTFSNCDFGNSTFNDRSRAEIIDANTPSGVGSIFGEGSFAMIVAIVALVGTGVSIWMNVSVSRKNKADYEDNGVEEEAETAAE